MLSRPGPAQHLQFALVVAVLATSSARADEREGPVAVEEEGKAQARDHRFGFAVVPGPTYSPALGWGIMVIPMAMYDLVPSDRLSPASTTAGFGFYTENESWGAGLFQKLYLDEDHWRLKGGGGFAHVNQRFYGVGADASGSFVGMTMEAVFALAEGLYQVFPSGYAGLIIWFRQSRFEGVDANADAVLDAAGLNRQWVHAITPGLRFDYDTRDVQTTPRRGLYVFNTLRGASTALGSSQSYARFSTYYAQFIAVDSEARHVLAWNTAVEAGFGDVPFEEYPDIAGNKALRGYIKGEYTDKNMLSAQVEWRWNVWWRLGLTAFGGLGTVFPSWGRLDEGTWLPSGGAGLRFTILPERGMNARLDFAWGKDGGNFYFSVGEAF
ncbi:MAG TPA: BamA/TamA family outer membrane protein [Anaeromyxobacteraceae bacterium]|nr:BamA/TamA family outer membrane protein [Anaeromyxobacteraceae bacterium]